MCVRLTDHARIAYQGLSNAAKASYEESKKALTERFEPSSKRELYLAEWHSRRKGNTEGWAEFAEDLKRLTQKAYPDLDDTAKEQMALVQYLAQLQNPQVAFSVKQKRPKTVDEAVAATLEMESYLTMPVSINTERRVNQVDMDSPIAEVDDLTVAATGNVSYQGELYHTMKKLLERVENIEARLQASSESSLSHQQRRTKDKSSAHSGTSSSGSSRQSQAVICRKCGKEGHFAYGCAARRGPQHQGN